MRPWWSRLCVMAVLLGGCITAWGQIQLERGFEMPPLGTDTTCFRYHFVPGDTLIYTIEASDSVAFLGDPVLLKIRRSVVSVICDSVTPKGHYRLRVTLRHVVERQTTVSDSSEHEGSPWVGREAFLEIDSLGVRHAVWVDDDHRAALTPGGAFQPLLLPTLGESCGVQNQSWMVQDTTLMVENGVPEAAYAHATLWRVIDKADTLGRRFHQIQYTQTGLGTVEVNSDRVKLTMHAVIAAYGKLSLDAELQVPFHLFATSEDRLEITHANGQAQKGKHLTSMHARLREIRSPDPARQMVLPR